PLPAGEAHRMNDATGPHVTALHLEHCRQLFLSERSRRETIRGSISTPVAAISFAVFALSNLAVALDKPRIRLTRWRRMSEANIGPNLFHHSRTVSWHRSIPRS